MYFGRRLLEVDVPTVGAEPADEKPMQQRADLLVTGTRGELGNQRVSFFRRQHARVPEGVSGGPARRCLPSAARAFRNSGSRVRATLASIPSGSP